MVISNYKETTNFEEVMNLVSAEQHRGAELAKQGILEAVYMSENQQKNFLVFNSENEQALQDVLDSLPLHPYLDFEVVAVQTLPDH
jgi:muconolactone D-isomerase